tara:strand:- start:222 stop:1316 length:1095 start_codon:yes stop_codon:yes gene_type:complete
MAKVKIQGHASGTGILTVTAPNTSTDRTITLPDATGTLLNSDGDGSSLTGITSVTALSGLSDAVGTVATHNLGLGENALDSLTSGGNYNVAVGKNALTAVSTGDFNVAVGFEAGAGIATTSANTAVGTYALYGTTGAHNVAIGDNTAQAALSGTGNTAVGRNALTLGTSGGSNTCLGYTAGDNITTGSSNIMIGDVSAASATDDNQLDIGGWIKGVAGQITMPNQPCFQAQITGDQNNITAAGGDIVITFNNEIFDNNADFNTGTYAFIAPVTGKYQLQCNIFHMTGDSSGGYYKLIISTSNRTYHNYIDPEGWDQDVEQWTQNICVAADMDAGDEAKVYIKQLAGTTQTDINGVSTFSGFLIC